MTDAQWQELLRVVGGEMPERLPVGLIVDSPWLPNWAGYSILDYYTSDEVFLAANLAAEKRFPAVWFLPGFWSEYGMCTEPSAFGALCRFPEDELPFAERILAEPADARRLKKPDCRRDGLAPFMIKRLVHCADRMEGEGHAVRFAVARGPLNIASFLLGHTEFLLAIRTDPEEVHLLLRIITDFLVDWLVYQKKCFPSIEGVLALDDLVGFIKDADFQEFAVPYLREIYAALDAPVKAFHNDAFGLITARHLASIGINLFNFSFEHPVERIRELAGETVTLLGNIPPRDVLAEGSAEDIGRSVAAMLAPLGDGRRLILSCGGGTPPGVPTENIDALCRAAEERVSMP